MKNLSDLLAAIEQRLSNAEALEGVTVLIEDAQELENKIEQALGQQGMLILIGQPVLENTTPLTRQANFKVSTSIAIGENPTLWRDGQKPTCVDVVQIVIRLLQGFPITGFQPLRVMRGDFIPDKKRQLYELPVETLLIFDPIP